MNAIGGYFGLAEADGEGVPWLDRSIGFRSARSALAAVLKAMEARAVWVPGYVCQAVHDAVQHSGAELIKYSLSADLGVPDGLPLAANAALICVDYFGLCGEQVSRCVARYGSERVVVDASQSMYCAGAAGASIIYSPRKMFGVPDGGLVRTDLTLGQVEAADEMDSLRRCAHLLLRRAGLVEDGYRMFGQSEETLSGCEPVALSKFTRRLLERVAFGRAAERRRLNYARLSSALRRQGYDVPEATEAAVPLCCPVTHAAASKLRHLLAEQRIYTPSYWPGAPIQADDEVGTRLRDSTVYLPCDQRYDADEMERVTRAMRSLRNSA